MHKSFFLVFIFAGLIALSGCTTKKENAPASLTLAEAPVSSPGEGTSDASGSTQQTAKYIQFSPEVLEKATNTRRVLFFFANWCPTCKPTDQDFIENISRLPSDVTLIRVNYNDPETEQAEKDLAQKYAVTYQHTLVQIDAEGKEVAKWNGGQIEEVLNNLQ